MNIEEAERIIARALHAMFEDPGSEEDIEARKDYLLKCKDVKNPDSSKLK